jgi:hypothetical protein
VEIFVDYVSVTSKAVAVVSAPSFSPTYFGFGTEGWNSATPRQRYFRGMIDAAAISDEVLGPGSFVLQRSSADLFPDAYTEDFETGWTNGAGGTLVNGAFPGRWAARDPGLGEWLVADVGSPQYKTLAFTNDAFNNSWWSIGGQYPFRLKQGKPVAIELNARIRQIAGSGMGWQGVLYLMNRNQNGYGLKLQRSLQNGFHGADNHNYVTIIKYRNSTVALGETGTPSWANSEGDEPVSQLRIGTAYDGFINFHLRFEQRGDGQPVTVRLWHTESNSADTSRGTPDLKWVDDGTLFGSILNVRDLQWVGVNAERTGGTTMPNTGVWFDDLRIEAVPAEVGTVTIMK